MNMIFKLISLQLASVVYAIYFFVRWPFCTFQMLVFVYHCLR